MPIICKQAIQIYKHFLKLMERLWTLEFEKRVCHLFGKPLNLSVLNCIVGEMKIRMVAMPRVVGRIRYHCT